MTKFQEIIKTRKPTWQEYIDEVNLRRELNLLPSRRMDGVCMYRLGDKQCIAGILIPDDTYYKSLEGRSAAKIFDCIRGPEGFTGTMALILQTLHDSDELDRMVEAMVAFSEKRLPSIPLRYYVNQTNYVETFEELCSIDCINATWNPSVKGIYLSI